MMRRIYTVLITVILVSSISAHASPEAISGTISLSPELRDKVTQTDVVYILARATNGPRIPIAVFRKQVKDLPLKFVLDDSMAMQPQVKISDFDQVKVAARISMSGGAVTRPGDFEGVSAAIKPGASGVDIVIDTEIISDRNTSLSL